MPTNYSPVDFFNPDYTQHENFRGATTFDITLGVGDCLYLPAYWWIQSETVGNVQTTVITFWYTVASEWLKLVFYGMEENLF